MNRGLERGQDIPRVTQLGNDKVKHRAQASCLLVFLLHALSVIQGSVKGGTRFLPALEMKLAPPGRHTGDPCLRRARRQSPALQMLPGGLTVRMSSASGKQGLSGQPEHWRTEFRNTHSLSLRDTCWPPVWVTALHCVSWWVHCRLSDGYNTQLP